MIVAFGFLFFVLAVSCSHGIRGKNSSKLPSSKAIVAKHDLLVLQILSEEDVELIESDNIHSVNAHSPSNIEEIKGCVPVVFIKAGQPLVFSDLQCPHSP